MWKSSQKLSAERSAVRPIVWLGHLPPPCENTGNKKARDGPGYCNHTRKSGLLGTRNNGILSGDDLPLPVTL
jgi:hypothetical protein